MIYQDNEKITVKEFLKTLPKTSQIKIGCWCGSVSLALDHIGIPISKLDSFIYAWNYQGQDTSGRSHFTIYL